MGTRVAAALSAGLIVYAAACAAEEARITGYGVWRFGMTPAEVSQVQESAPYLPVNATGGLETANGKFLGEKTNISFIFGARGLRRIQIWAYEGHDFGAAVKAFYATFKHLADFGALRLGDDAAPARLTLEAFQQRIPPSFSDQSRNVTMDQLQAKGSLQAQGERLHLGPERPPTGGTVFSSLIHSPQLGVYYVFLYYDAPPAPPGKP
jgi:hypothetical protein